jgi:mannose-6-phosphate isomerase
MSLPVNYPLRFEPIYQERIWGGHRLRTTFSRVLPAGKRIGESWEISDYGDQLSVIANGPLRGRTLRELMRTNAESILGRSAFDRTSPAANWALRFPLLVKWIDAQESLSIQVHPPDGHARLPAGERGKTECWLVLDAEPESAIYLGLRGGIDLTLLRRELARGTIDRCLNRFPACPGDFFFVPAGTLHAIGSGVLLGEVQQTSDTTFRLFDWNRTDPATGQPRVLQVEAALECIDFQSPVPRPTNIANAATGAVTTLVGFDRSPHFAVSWRRLETPDLVVESGRCRILMCVSGAANLAGAFETVPLTSGDCVLLPANVEFRCTPADSVETLVVDLPG